MRISRSAIAAGILLILTSTPPASGDCEFPAVFNFGDSNSDTGGLSAIYGQVPPPNGRAFFHFPSGRYCDGRLLIDFIAERLGIPYLSAYLDAMGSNFSHGANFATAGATVRPQNTTRSQSGVSPVSLDVQLVEFSNFRVKSRAIRRKGGIFAELMPREDYFAHALYTFDIGQNDIMAGYKLNLSDNQVKEAFPDVLAQFSAAIRNLYAQGGRSFWIHNTGPLGCLPYVLDRFLITAAQVDKYGCASPFNGAARFFNDKLKEAMIKLRKQLPYAAITYVDIYSVKHALIAQAKNLGFEKPLMACCGHGGKYNFNNAARCGSTKTVNGTEIVIAKSCEDPSVRVSWDGIHYTEAANEWIFDQIVNGSFSDPSLPLKLACHRSTGSQ